LSSFWWEDTQSSNSSPEESKEILLYSESKCSKMLQANLQSILEMQAPIVHGPNSSVRGTHLPRLVNVLRAFTFEKIKPFQGQLTLGEY